MVMQPSMGAVVSRRPALMLLVVIAFVLGVLVLLGATMDAPHNNAPGSAASRALRIEAPGWTSHMNANPVMNAKRVALSSNRVRELHERAEGLFETPHRPVVQAGWKGPVKRLPMSHYESNYYGYYGNGDDEDGSDESDSDSDDSNSGSDGSSNSGSGKVDNGSGAGIHSSIVMTTDGVNIGNTIISINIQGIGNVTTGNTTSDGTGG